MGGAEREQSRLLTIGRQEGPGRSRATVETAQRCGRATLTAGRQGLLCGGPRVGGEGVGHAVCDPPLGRGQNRSYRAAQRARETSRTSGSWSKPCSRPKAEV